MADEETVRCRKCRKILVTDLDCLLNAHGRKHQGGKAGNDEEITECTIDSERSCIFISEDSYPLFVTDALNESSWTKGKLHCPGCQARIGSFNYVSGSHCSCKSHIVPQVHMLVSKVDVRRAMEVLPNPVSYPDHPVALSASDIESFPVLISTEPSADQSNSACLPPPSTKEPLQTCNDKSKVSITNQGNTHLDAAESIEPTPELFVDAQSELPRMERRSDIRRRQTHRQLPFTHDDFHQADTSAKSSNSQLLASEEESSDHEEKSRQCEDIPLHLTCSVCLDLLYSPFIAEPCSHVFCEPCLRRLARPNPTRTCCPLCRQMIGQCMPSRDLAAEVRDKFPDLYQERHQFEQKHSMQHIPLPWIKNFKKDQLAAQRSSLIQMAGGWRPVLWMLGVNVLGFGSLVLLRYHLKSQKIEMERDPLDMGENDNLHME